MNDCLHFSANMCVLMVFVKLFKKKKVNDREVNQKLCADEGMSRGDLLFVYFDMETVLLQY